ncbi:hypothetical protein EB118_00805 [bacterium]|nr:hypothetical protein [bacterium]NBX98402.1 hypothetical protein [bacterium]NDC93694.1 hypothetical protein [bacterium]NDD84646.1 hypothetical protein [bacterium]NDG28630.1 hypothetical protein [bacterium]
MNTQPYKGSRDFYPEDKRLQKWLFAKWAEVCETFGYEQYDAPMLSDNSKEHVMSLVNQHNK